MEFVDEGDDFAFGFLNFVENGLEAFFEFAPVFSAGHHGTQVEADETLPAEGFRHVAGDDAAGEAFDDGGFTHAGFADEHRVVFGAAA